MADSRPINTQSVKAVVAKDKTGTFELLLEIYPAQTPEEATKRLIKTIDRAIWDKDSGKFLNMDGTKIA